MGSFGFKVRFYSTILSLHLAWDKVFYPLECRSSDQVSDMLVTFPSLGK